VDGDFFGRICRHSSAIRMISQSFSDNEIYKFSRNEGGIYGRVRADYLLDYRRRLDKKATQCNPSSVSLKVVGGTLIL
jgi:hypothetical protein